MFKLTALFTLGLVGASVVFGAAIPRASEPCDDDTNSTITNVDISTSGDYDVTLNTSSTTNTTLVESDGSPPVIYINGVKVTPSDKAAPEDWWKGLEVGW